MNHAFTQEELAEFVNEGKTIMLGFWSAASIVWSHGAGEYILSPMPHKGTKLPFTKRGRRQAVTPDLFEKILAHS